MDNGVYWAAAVVGKRVSNKKLMVTVKLNDPEPPTGKSNWTFFNTEVEKASIGDLILDNENIVWFPSIDGNEILNINEKLEDGKYYAASIIDGCIGVQRLEVNVKIIEGPLLLYYSFDNEANDTTANNFDGFFNATIVETDLNKFAKFNGIDETVTLPNSNYLKPNFPFSFSFWAKFEDYETANSVIFTNNYEENNHTGAWMNLSSSNSLSVSVGNGNGPYSYARKTFKSDQLIELNQWYHISAVLINIDDFRIYLNGEPLNGVFSGTGNSLVYGNRAGVLGKKDSSGTLPPFYFKGCLDEFACWNIELSQEFIKNTYDEQKSLFKLL